MAKNITEQIAELESENERFRELDKLFEKAIKIEFGSTRKSIHSLMKNEEKCSEFEAKICNYFGLKNQEDMDAFLSIMCSENSLKFYNSKANNYSENVPEQG